MPSMQDVSLDLRLPKQPRRVRCTPVIGYIALKISAYVYAVQNSVKLFKHGWQKPKPDLELGISSITEHLLGHIQVLMKSAAKLLCTSVGNLNHIRKHGLRSRANSDEEELPGLY